MSMICRKSMSECRTPGMCSPFGGCQNPAQSELAALREELAKSKQRSARLELASASEFESVQLLDNENSVLKQRLADAERRNMFCESMLRQIMPCLAMSTNTTAPTYMRQIDAALTKPEETKS